MSRPGIITGLLLIVALTACESGLDQRYLDVTLSESLELPPDLGVIEGESRFELPAVFSGDDPQNRDDVPVLAKVESLRLQGSANLYWLEVEEPVDNLYQQVRNFWASEGYRLIVDEPVIGIMQTEWVYKEEGGEKEDAAWYENLFGNEDLSASQDQFRTRIERDPDGLNRIYIAHRGTEYVHVVKTGDRFAPGDVDNDWDFRQPEPELEIEMLSRLMVFLGLRKAEVDQQVAGVELFAPRAFIHFDAEENSPFIVLRDPYHIAWNRVYHQLERMNFEIADTEFRSGLTGEGSIRIKTQVEKPEEEGGFFSFLSSDDDEVETVDYILVFLEETHEVTRVLIENRDGDLDNTPEGSEFLKLIYQQVR